jgi:hypothetical protein
MGSLETSAQKLEQANESIKLLLCTVVTPHMPVSVRRGELSQIRSLMLEVKSYLKTLGEGGADPVLQVKIAEYFRNIERLGKVLPKVHAWLLCERERLQRARETVGSAQAWAAAQKTTL